jgi:hypothetical protein
LKNTHRWKGLGTWLKWYCACLASTQPWVQTPVPPPPPNKAFREL